MMCIIIIDRVRATISPLPLRNVFQMNLNNPNVRHYDCKNKFLNVTIVVIATFGAGLQGCHLHKATNCFILTLGCFVFNRPGVAGAVLQTAS